MAATGRSVALLAISARLWPPLAISVMVNRQAPQIEDGNISEAREKSWSSGICVRIFSAMSSLIGRSPSLRPQQAQIAARHFLWSRGPPSFRLGFVLGFFLFPAGADVAPEGCMPFLNDTIQKLYRVSSVLKKDSSELLQPASSIDMGPYLGTLLANLNFQVDFS